VIDIDDTLESGSECLSGGYAAKRFKLPNRTYFTP
jgi:hypothetical protein